MKKATAHFLNMDELELHVFDLRKVLVHLETLSIRSHPEKFSIRTRQQAASVLLRYSSTTPADSDGPHTGAFGA
jgi:hypothetical protein